MQYTDTLASQIIKAHGLGRTVQFRWKKQGYIPDDYFQPDFSKPQPLSPAEHARQEGLLQVIDHPVILHSAFTGSAVFKGKLDEMLSLRRRKKAGRPHYQRPNVPTLNLSPGELTDLTTQFRELALSIRVALKLARSQPWVRGQLTLRELLRAYRGLTTRQVVREVEDKPGATRWINFVAGVRSPLPESDRGVVAVVMAELEHLTTLIDQAFFNILEPPT